MTKSSSPSAHPAAPEEERNIALTIIDSDNRLLQFQVLDIRFYPVQRTCFIVERQRTSLPGAFTRISSAQGFKTSSSPYYTGNGKSHSQTFHTIDILNGIINRSLSLPSCAAGTESRSRFVMLSTSNDDAAAAARHSPQWRCLSDCHL